jgi:hypothetical protein
VAHYGCGQQITHIFDKQIGVNMKTEVPTAFPWSHGDLTCTGMGLRDYFAAKAMPVAIKTLMHDYTRDDEDWSWESYIDNDMLAELSYEMADAMLKARESNQQE